MNYIRSTPLIFFLLLATNVHWHAADAVSIEDMLFPEPSFDGNTPPSVALTFLNGVVRVSMQMFDSKLLLFNLYDSPQPSSQLVRISLSSFLPSELADRVLY